MKILRVRAHDFGKLNGELDLAPGMTVIHGENEAGKSTWLQAIFAGLCGRRRGRGANTLEEREFERQYEPWNGRPWRATIKFQLDSGRRIEIQQNDLKAKESSASDDDTGRPVGDEIIYGGSIDGSSFLGLNRQVVPSTLVIAQGDIQRLRKRKGDEASALREELQRAAASAGGAATAVEALRTLKDYASNQIGAERRNSTRPLQHAIERTGRAATALEAGRSRQLERNRLEDKLAAAQDRAESSEALARCCERIRNQRELDRLDACLAEIDRLAPLFPAGEAPPAPGEGKAAALAQVLREAAAAYRVRPAEPSEVDGPSAEEMEEQLTSLPQAPEGDAEVAPEVAAAARRWRAASEARALSEQYGPDEPPQTVIAKADERVTRQALETLELPPLESMAGAERHAMELREERHELNQVESRGVPKWAWPGAVAGSLLGLLATMDWQSRLVGAGGWLLAIVCYGFILRAHIRFRPAGLSQRAMDLGMDLADAEADLRDQKRKHKQREKQLDAAHRDLASLGLETDPDVVRQALAALKDREAWDREQSAWERRVGRAREAEAAAEKALRIALSGRGLDDQGASTADLLDQYEQMCRHNATLAAGTDRRDALTARMKAQRQREQMASSQLKGRAEAEARFKAALAAAGFPADSTEPPERWTTAWIEEQGRRLGDQRRNWDRLQHLLDGRDRKTLVTQRDGVAARLDVAFSVQIDNASVFQGLTETELEQKLADARTEAGAARVEVGNYEGQLTKEADLPSLAELEEEQAAAEREVALLRRAASILNTAQEHLKEARDEVHRILAPDLRQALGERLGLVTGSRYSSVRIDPEQGLEVQIEVEEGNYRSASELSHGTVDQVYLLLRIALAEALGDKKESAPLFLDDATVHIDTGRTMRFLELLLALSQERQIVVFSQEEEVRAWAEGRLVADARHRLIELDRQGCPVEPDGDWAPDPSDAEAGTAPEPQRQHSLL